MVGFMDQNSRTPQTFSFRQLVFILSDNCVQKMRLSVDYEYWLSIKKLRAISGKEQFLEMHHLWTYTGVRLLSPRTMTGGIP